MEEQKERIAKYLARAGIASRRAVETMIGEGRVSVNGSKLDTPAFLVDGSEDIRVDGKKVGEKTETRLFLYHKAPGLVTSHKDEQDRKTVFDQIREDHPELPRLISVGRLDLNSEGLLLLTNDGALSRALELPSSQWVRTYRVRAFGFWNKEKQGRLAKGLKVNGVHYGKIQCEFESLKNDNVWLKMSLSEGKNREIRRVMEAMDMQVNRLIRVSYGPFELDTLKVGAVREVPQNQIKKLTTEARRHRDKN